MKTLILTKRVMSPRNILNNLVEGDINKVMKAMDYFKEACRPTVGYKQIAAYLGMEVIVARDELVSEVVKPKSAIEISNEIKKAKYKEEAEAMKKAMLERKRDNRKAVTPVVKKESEEKVKTNEEGQQGQLDFTDIPAEVEIESSEQIVHNIINEYFSEVQQTSYKVFADELYKGFRLKTTRRLDEIERVIKAVYKKHKPFMSNPEACRNLCIQAREMYLEMMDENPNHWTWIPTTTYTSKWFSKAVRECDPDE